MSQVRSQLTAVLVVAAAAALEQIGDAVRAYFAAAAPWAVRQGNPLGRKPETVPRPSSRSASWELQEMC
jgi:hypothetical protein